MADQERWNTEHSVPILDLRPHILSVDHEDRWYLPAPTGCSLVLEVVWLGYSTVVRSGCIPDGRYSTNRRLRIHRGIVRLYSCSVFVIVIDDDPADDGILTLEPATCIRLSDR